MWTDYGGLIQVFSVTFQIAIHVLGDEGGPLEGKPCDFLLLPPHCDGQSITQTLDEILGH